MVPAEQAHSSNSKLACMKQENRFYPLPRLCSVHFACHYPAPMHLAWEPITTGSWGITIHSNYLFYKVIYCKGVSCSQRRQWPWILKSRVILKRQVLCVYVCVYLCVLVPPEYRQSIIDIESTGWQYLLFPQLKSQQRNIYSHADWPGRAGCERKVFSKQFLNYPAYC